jgi:ribonuclease D
MTQTITTTDALAAFCAARQARPYVTVDTEFLRERTYFEALPGAAGAARQG